MNVPFCQQCLRRGDRLSATVYHGEVPLCMNCFLAIPSGDTPMSPFSHEMAAKEHDALVAELERQATEIERLRAERIHPQAGVTLDDALSMLADCYRLTGDDPDGNEDWRLAGHAQQAVDHQRQRLDAVEQQRDAALALLREAEEMCRARAREVYDGDWSGLDVEAFAEECHDELQVMANTIAELAKTGQTGGE